MFSDFTEGPIIEINAPFDLNFAQVAAHLNKRDISQSNGQLLLASLPPNKLPFAFNLTLRPELEQVIEANGGSLGLLDGSFRRCEPGEDIL